MSNDAKPLTVAQWENLGPGEYMSALQQIDATVRDNERLRALIKAQERAANLYDKTSDACPWCNSDVAKYGRHRDDCPAFTPEGEVR